MQHGPLHIFHLYLNHGIALCKYSSREEANKAQMALNNCVLGNTTICAESPSESEVQNILQHLGVPAAQPTGGSSVSAQSWRPPSQQAPSRTAGEFFFSFSLLSLDPFPFKSCLIFMKLVKKIAKTSNNVRQVSLKTTTALKVIRF